MNRAAMDDLGRLVLRVALGALILLHGISKLRNGLGPIEEMVTAHGMPSFVAYGVLVGEVVAPLMLLLGFYARIGGLLIAINMLFAIGLAHMSMLTQLNSEGGWALELQGMYLATAIAIALIGPGKYSLGRGK